MNSTSAGNRSYILLLSIFIGCITIASVLANKIITVFGLFVPAGVLAYSITFICTDVISEIWGRARANETVAGGFVALIFTLILVQLSLAWPKAPFWDNDIAFRSVLVLHEPDHRRFLHCLSCQPVSRCVGLSFLEKNHPTIAICGCATIFPPLFPNFWIP